MPPIRLPPLTSPDVGARPSESEVLETQYETVKIRIDELVGKVPELKTSLSLPDVVAYPGDPSLTADAMNKQLSALCIGARRKARLGGLTPEIGSVVDTISRTAYSGLIEYPPPGEPSGSSASEEGPAESDDTVSDWRGFIVDELSNKRKYADLDAYLAEIPEETPRRTRLRHMLGAVSLRLFGGEAGESGEAAEDEMFYSGSYTIPVEIETDRPSARGRAVAKFALHRFTDSPGEDYRAVRDLINVDGFGKFADYPTSLRVLRSLILSPGNPKAFGNRVCASMAAKINTVEASSPNYSVVFSGESMGCLLLGRMAPLLKTIEKDVFHFRNPLLLNPKLDLPTGVTTHIAYAETEDRVVGFSGLRRKKSKMHQACFNKGKASKIVLLPLSGAPCTAGGPRMVKYVLGSNHLCIMDLLINNIEAETGKTAGGVTGGYAPSTDGDGGIGDGDVCLTLPGALFLEEEELKALAAGAEGAGGDSVDVETEEAGAAYAGGSPGPNNGSSFAAAALLMLAVTVSASIAGAR